MQQINEFHGYRAEFFFLPFEARHESGEIAFRIPIRSRYLT
jgi:hypothetical protein